ncbi:transposase [Siphonobacter sp. SORGH_AS_0500]|uniref:transposase n=1 Tax=Siphonobacter sp. SORGH_AS_0500 TaxID=1864824 RepID=UPI002865BDE4|nr:transposase [Siphonobacter sp. SORGH_AS_0500]MDR6195380.1 putative transposase [Siphonobacter sp. SORGH_AS_0500]
MVNEDKGQPQGLPLRMIRYNPAIHHRRSIRLKGYDYSQAGLYFITICVQNRECLFGEILKGELFLNEAGQMVVSQWSALPERFKNIVLHEFVVMPNHFHAILEIETVGATLVVASSAKNWRSFNGKLWQRNYWEHIIRNEQSYQTISNYIVNNPLNWETDQLHHS